MRIEEIAIRQEIRQILSEAGYNRNTMPSLVKRVLNEEIEKATKQAIKEKDSMGYIQRRIDAIIQEVVERTISDEIEKQMINRVRRLSIDVTVHDKEDPDK